jgi:hypothetical protein
MRTFDIEIVTAATKDHETHGFNPVEWLEDTENIALVNDQGDLALFERFSPSLVYGHYFFKSRGKEAITVAKAFLTEAFFTEEYSIKVIAGLTPVEHLGAKWLTRRLGFKFQEVLDSVSGPHELYILTQQEWKTHE